MSIFKFFSYSTPALGDVAGDVSFTEVYINLLARSAASKALFHDIKAPRNTAAKRSPVPE